MGKPRMIILIRHAQSEGNKNRDIHQTIPDHRVKLTAEGWRQAEEAGIRLRSMLRPDDTLHFFTSPYRRTRETTEGILSSLTAETPTSPSLFPRHTIKVYEEPRLREQDFGNFQPCSAEMERMWHERADYGHFFYRIPNGESAADAYDRVSGFNESLWRQFGENDFASVCVLVTHGLMTRVFLMKWYHYSVEYFEDLRNVNHCEFVVMNKDYSSGRYILENKLRTWSELKRERSIAEGRTLDKQLEEHSIPQKKWGGCPHGCDHAKFKPAFKRKRENTGELSQKDLSALDKAELSRKQSLVKNSEITLDIQPELSNVTRGRVDTSKFAPNKKEMSLASSPQDMNSYLQQRLDSPYRLSVLQVGRDFGGSRSGVASREGSYSSGSDHEDEQDQIQKDPLLASNGMEPGALADALGDRRDADGEDEDADLKEAEARDKSVQGSVY
ncbi:MAG: hypothetical protein M1839_000559 [Geoglossum umbratile]|nr:MAG: hypothetical protein M1839_000559 [Geoglossum umbratile]